MKVSSECRTNRDINVSPLCLSLRRTKYNDNV